MTIRELDPDFRLGGVDDLERSLVFGSSCAKADGVAVRGTAAVGIDEGRRAAVMVEPSMAAKIWACDFVISFNVSSTSPISELRESSATIVASDKAYFCEVFLLPASDQGRGSV